MSEAVTASGTPASACHEAKVRRRSFGLTGAMLARRQATCSARRTLSQRGKIGAPSAVCSALLCAASEHAEQLRGWLQPPLSSFGLRARNVVQSRS